MNWVLGYIYFLGCQGMMSEQIKANALTNKGRNKSVVISFEGEASPLIFLFLFFIHD